MKKIALVFGILGLFFVSNIAKADVFDSLDGITPAQKARISTVQNTFKVQNNDLEKRIMNYTNEISKAKQDTNKTDKEISLITDTYERNIETLKNQQKNLEKETDEKYKSILTESQYKQYQALQLKVQNSFQDFLQK